MSPKSLCLALTLLIAQLPALAGFLDKEVVFSEADIQAALDKRGPQERHYGKLLGVVLRQPPRIQLGRVDGRASVQARLELSLLGQAPVPVEVEGTAGIRYDETAKAFYLDKPVADSVSAATLSRDGEAMVRQAASQAMAAYFKNNPVYVLREDGSAEERAARWLLRAVRIEQGRVVATLSPL